ncbi:uncharacterized protein LOC116012464 isoform X1 [Ipomoea triloba]|uniref:uncharacterized protein LOC116012464 isoform X1 n=1 Tax=Ipomoea triloba TaxID=35885 RepID=UPI00125DEF6B|nr:uncharacterized protein LOC116012464 isoform X1 [Ipomoea triloba]
MEKGNSHSYNKKQQAGAHTSSSSSFTTDLFGPKDRSKSSASSAGLFVSVFGESSMGRESSQSGVIDSSRMQNSGGQYSNARYGNSDHETQRGWDSKDKSSVYHTESSEPCYFSSSIYYGGQDNYPPPTHTTSSQHTFKKDGGEDDQNGNNSNCASRGNWWQGITFWKLLQAIGFLKCYFWQKI